MSDNLFSKTIQINAPTAKVWHALTSPALMPIWMSDSEINIITDWRVGSPMLIRGRLHGIPFANKGTVLQFEPEKLLHYSHLSSLSRLPDKPESYSVLEFSLLPTNQHTSLTLKVSNFPTATIYKHLAFYWGVTLERLKRMLEAQE